MTSSYAKPVPGSAVLKTRAQLADPELRAVEELPDGQLERHEIGDEALGRVVIRESFVPVLAQVLDELVTQQTPIEQSLYLQLYRRSYGRDCNFCRVARAELCSHIGLSQRRFNRALGGLVAKGHVRLLQRDRRGTLYRVLLPDEIAGRRPGSRVLLGKLRTAHPSPGRPGGMLSKTAKPLAAKRGNSGAGSELSNRSHKVISNSDPLSARKSPRRASGNVSKRSQKVTPNDEVNTVGQLAGRLLERLPPRLRQTAALDVLQDITDLVEDGCSLQDLSAVVEVYPAPRGGQPLHFAQFARRQLGLETG